MNRGWPDWMFAAFAIGGWELFDLIARHWHVPTARWIGGAIALICVVVIGIRYVLRWWYRRNHPEPEPDPNEWENY